MVFARAATAIKKALAQPKTITHLGLGKADVKRVASNRRVLGPDGKVQHIRWSKTIDPAARAAPEGIIDPAVRVVQSLERRAARGRAELLRHASPELLRQGQMSVATSSASHGGCATRPNRGSFFVHFNGAAGNVTAGKYNDGSPENRPALAHRLADWNGRRTGRFSAHKTPITAADVQLATSTRRPSGRSLDGRRRA